MLRILLSLCAFQLLTWIGGNQLTLSAETEVEPQDTTQEAAGVVAPSGETNPTTESEQAAVEWHTDYGKAIRIAQAQEKMVFIEFQSSDNAAQRRFDTETQLDDTVRELLRRYVAVRLPLDVEITVGGAVSRLLNHPAFAELNGRPGIAIIDYAHHDADYYGHVVTAVSFVPGKFYRFHPRHLAVALDLPPGTLTQRTMVFAVRIHPEAPASTRGELDPMLATEASSHSTYQAQIRVQGHHHWGRRFPRLSRLLPRGLRAQEVVAESWPHEGLVDAAVDCVDSWRQSSGHWSAVRAKQPRFGYDMQRGGNGIWYATGLFGN
ncbi:MAG TPA: hypothetical protein VND64_37640 [Pirellulales bacterium]|nr:hypothetical protein [Pirellulales bacterium]